MVVNACSSFVSVSFSQNFVLRSAPFGPNSFFWRSCHVEKKYSLKGCSGGVFNTFSKHVNCSDHMRWEGTMAFAALRHALSLEILESWRQPLS